LRRIDLLDALAEIAQKPASVRLADAVSGKTMLTMPVNRKSGGDLPFLTVHRANLHGVLHQAASANPAISIIKGYRIASVSRKGAAATLQPVDDDQSAIQARLLVGADGIWSRVRSAVSGAATAQATGRIALRAVVPARSGKGKGNHITAWMAPDSHLVSYPVRNTDTRNLVAIIPGTAQTDIWDGEANAKTLTQLDERFSSCGFGDRLSDVKWTVWPLASLDPGMAWHDDEAIVLVGDAAHAMEPFAAQGAAMAIEDGYVLAKSLAEHADNPKAAFRAYQSARQARVTRVHKRTDFNRRVYHMGGAARLARNAAFRLRPNARFAADLDWLYDFRA
jgi:salicylate hydroxylase